MHTESEIYNFQNINNLKVTDIFELEYIQRMQDMFSNATGVASIITYPDGSPVTTPSNFCRLCKDIIRNTEIGRVNCMKSDAIIGRLNSDGPIVQPCLSGGLWDAGASIKIGNKHIANWLIGQVRSKDADIEDVIGYADEIGVDKVEFLKAWEAVPIMSKYQFQKIAEMLYFFANELSEKAYLNLQLKQEIIERNDAEEILQKSQESLYITLNSIGDGVISTDINGFVVEMNPVAQQLCGWKLQDAKGQPLKSVFNIINTRTRKPVENPVNNVLKTGKVMGLANHTVLLSKNGKEYQISDSAAPIKSKDGLIIGVVLVFSDVTEKYNAEEIVRQNEKRYSGLLNNLDAGVVVHAPDSSIVFSNFKATELLGLSEDQLRGKTGFDPEWHFLHESGKKMSIDQYPVNLIIANKRELKNYTLGVHQSVLTDTVWLVVNGFPEFDRNGEISEIVISFIDITKRKIAENALRESEKKFHDYIKFAPHGVFIADENGKYIEVNAAASTITGYSTDELLTMEQTNLIADESIELFDNHFKTVVKNGFATDEFILINKNKSRKFVTVDTVKISEKRFIGFVVDISKRKLVEKALKSSESYLKETQLIAHLGTYSIYFGTPRWECSDILKDILGINDSFEFTIENGIEMLHPEWSKNVYDYFCEEVLKKKSKFDKKIKIIRPLDQQVRWIHALGEMVFDENEMPIKMIGTIQDITHRKNLAEALRSSEALYKSILNASPDAIIVVDIDGFIRMTSPAALILYGISDISLLTGKNIYDYLVANDRDRAKSNARRMFEEYIGTNEYQILKSNGTSFYADVNGDVIWDRYGQPTGMLFIIRDVSERKKTELSLVDSQNQLKKFASHLQNVREEERVLLASEIHDELGQILIAMKIDLGLLKQKVLKSSKNKAIEDILTKFDNVFGLVDNTINTTRKIMTELRPEVLYMLGFVDGIKFYSKKFEERHKIKCNFENSVSELSLHPDQSIALFRVFQEALTNIVQHSKATEVRILLNRTDSQLSFEIVDNGIGFKDNTPMKKDAYGIIGMRERVLLFEGELSIIAQPGKGTNVKVKMPLNNQQINL